MSDKAGSSNIKKLKQYLKLGSVVVFLIVLWLLNYLYPASVVPLKSLTLFKGFLIEMLVFLPAMFVLIGLFDEWVPKSLIEPYIGQGRGIRGAIFMILFAMLQAGPLYGAFPVAYILWKKGATIKNIFIYLGAFSTMKIPMLTFETAFMGWKFTILRSLITLPVFICIAILLEYILEKKDFKVHPPEGIK